LTKKKERKEKINWASLKLKTFAELGCSSVVKHLPSIHKALGSKYSMKKIF
jgi:hypothetical protein